MDKSKLSSELALPIVAALIISALTSVGAYLLYPLLDRSYVTGEIFDGKEPEYGVEVALSNQNREFGRAKTDREGRFSFRAPNPGDYYLTFESTKLKFNREVMPKYDDDEDLDIEDSPVPFFHKITVQADDSLHVPININRVGVVTFVSPMSRLYKYTVDGKRITDIETEDGPIDLSKTGAPVFADLEAGYMTTTFAVRHGVHEYSLMMSDVRGSGKVVELESGEFNIQSDTTRYAQGIYFLSLGAECTDGKFLFFPKVRSIGLAGEIIEFSLRLKNVSKGKSVDLRSFGSSAESPVEREIADHMVELSFPVSTSNFDESQHEFTLDARGSNPAVSDTRTLKILTANPSSTMEERCS